MTLKTDGTLGIEILDKFSIHLRTGYHTREPPDPEKPAPFGGEHKRGRGSDHDRVWDLKWDVIERVSETVTREA